MLFDGYYRETLFPIRMIANDRGKTEKKNFCHGRRLNIVFREITGFCIIL